MATAKTEDVYSALRVVDVSDHVEEKDTGRAKLKYLSWAWAWDEVRKRYPSATYSIIKNDQGLPYFADPQLGIMVYTTVTIDEETHEMWLPVMDGANNPMRLEPYDITTNWGKKHVNAATMFDINKTVMRCLTKNLAMFGIGLALYAGEDLFDDTEGNKGEAATSKAKPTEKKVQSKENDTESKETKEATMDLNDVIKQLDERIKVMVAKMNEKQKNALADKIKAKCGITNYRKCTNVNALCELLEELNAA